MIQGNDLSEASAIITASPDATAQFNSFNYKQEFYQINDVVKLTLRKTIAKHTHFAAQLQAVFLVRDFRSSSLNFPVLKVRYYFDRHSLSDNFKSFKKQLSENELFLSDVEALIPINFLSGKMRVTSLEEYLANPDEVNLKFTQAEYLTKIDKIVPSLSSRERVCYCQLVENPDFNYIMCENCKKWYHYYCVGISDHNESLSLNFVCRNCQPVL